MGKQSKSFHDAFNEVITEAHLGAGTSMPGGISSWNTDSSSKTRRGPNPPFSLYSADTGQRPTGTGIVEQPPEEREAPKIFPFPLEHVGEYITNGYISLYDVRKLVKESIKNPMVTPTMKLELEIAVKELDGVLEKIKNIGDNVLKIKLSV